MFDSLYCLPPSTSEEEALSHYASAIEKKLVGPNELVTSYDTTSPCGESFHFHILGGVCNRVQIVGLTSPLLFFRKAVSIILTNSRGEILAVSRKDDPTLFCLPGGKVEEGETLEEAIIRETKEETGFDVSNLKLVDTREYGISDDTFYEQNMFTGDWEGVIDQEKLNLSGELGVVKWVRRDILESSPFFGEYNKLVFNRVL